MVLVNVQNRPQRVEDFVVDHNSVLLSVAGTLDRRLIIVFSVVAQDLTIKVHVIHDAIR